AGGRRHGREHGRGHRSRRARRRPLAPSDRILQGAHPQRAERHPAARRARPRARTLHGSLRPRRPGRGRARLLREARARVDERLMDGANAGASASETSAGELLAEVHAGVATVTLNRPAALNALSFGMLEELADLLARWETDANV